MSNSRAPDPAGLALALAVRRFGSIAAAARDERVDASAASRRLSALEARLGFALFERSTRRLTPTEAGEVWLARAAVLAREWDALAEAAETRLRGPSGRLAVTASVALGTLWLVPRLVGFRQAHPSITLDLHLSDAVMELREEGLDAALRLGPHVTGEAVSARLADVSYRVVAAPAYLERHGRPDGPDALADHVALVSPLPGHAGPWAFERAGRRTSVPISPVLTTTNALALRQATLEGLGVARLADWLVGEDVRAGRLEALCAGWHTGPDPANAIWLVTRGRDTRPAKLQAFVEHMSGHAQRRYGRAGAAP